MKTISYLVVMIACVALIYSCNKIDYRKTENGLLYKIIPGNSKDSAARPGDWIKIHYMQKRNDDSVLQSSYGKMPFYEQVAAASPELKYNPAEIFHLLKKGDSAVAVMFIDSLVNKKLVSQLPPFLKKGDKLTLTFKVIEIFRNDSTYRADAQVEYQKNLPAIEKERAEQKVRQEQEMKAQQEAMKIQLDKEYAVLEQSGEAAKQRKVVEDYLSAKRVSAQRTGKGTYVTIKEQGNGPQAAAGKFVTVKYTGRILATDSTFESNVYPSLQLGTASVIGGWDEGLLLFKEGGKGTLFIPGYLAYGKEVRPGSPFGPNEALIFDVEVLKVSDQPEPQQ